MPRYCVARRLLLIGGVLLALFGRGGEAHALDVWLDFVSDFHDGANGASNGVADWIDELNEATAEAGVDAFNAAERSQIEGIILNDLEIIYAGYDLQFVLTEPAGEHDVIYMARDNDHPDVSSTNRGSAAVDIGNQDTNGYTTRNGNPASVPKVTTANFDSNLETTDPRDRQILEIATALAGTAAHELGHTFGLLHHYVYSAQGITPANYGNTGGLQNQHILATGDTGITEVNRETRRALSPFSRVMLDITGGSNASFNEENISVVVGGLVSDRTEDEGADAGSTIDDAWPLQFEIGPTSGLPIAFLEADLDGSAADVDVFGFEAPVASTLVAHVFSERLDRGSREFDAILELLDSNGDVLMTVDDIGFDDNVYNDLVSPEGEDDDPFLVNIPLELGEYFLRVLPTTVDSSDTPNVGDVYWLVASLDPHPLLAGDYNSDGLVDAADYTVWRDTLGDTVSIPFFGADGDGDQMITSADYDIWVAGFGNAMAAGVPEPAVATLIVTVTIGCGSLRRARREVAMGHKQGRRQRVLG